MVKAARQNPKYEARKSKQIPKSKQKNSKQNTPLQAIRVCLIAFAKTERDYTD